MKKYTIGLLSILALVAITTVTTAPTSAVASGAVGPATPAIARCNKQADNLAKVPTDLEFFKATYYTMPSAAEIAAHYPPVVKRGSSVPIPTAIYKGPGPQSRVGKTNYVLVAKRFIDTQSYFSHIVLKGTTTPAFDPGALHLFANSNDSINTAITNQVSAIDAVKTAFPVGVYDCATSQNRSIVATKYRAKVAAFKKLNKDIKVVRDSTKDSRARYQNLESERLVLVRQHKI